MSSGIPAGYLRRLGVTGHGRPCAEGLFALQRAHLERVAYDNIDIQLGRPPGIDPERSARRVATGGGGYCFHLNGAFALLLESLGYAVTRHAGGVNADPGSRTVSGDHLALTVRVGGAGYFVDTGLGDGPYEPLPLREGTYEQGRFRYTMERLEPLEGEGPGWTYRNPGGPMPRVNFRDAPAAMSDFAAMDTRLSTDAESPFVRTLALLRRDADGVDVLRGRVLSRIDPAKGTSERELAGQEEFCAAVEGVFGRRLDDLTPADRAALWAAACRSHEAWLSRRAKGA
ncbi:arylamine N-acetyltransferase family protein [Streptomyces antarcticus]|uniref:arylamine N-acetyltransferase family protein n=1 Tax=Streptomyces antarcticus TaxID=2996458 RepID=UPI0022710B38|nr:MULTISPECIES: arylamine N-acetyltransferase [unclassified Streptomyces]MCY0945047.1 arylamine N-acetyltransferase [Streptomyces sp. H34-AA3]MCZ4084115.1 arylamine N-acetyltransferase [Streptomyces sp. H34-S5]